MPTSLLAIWPEIIALVEQVPHRRVLDVGPGYGKAATLLREYLNDKPHRLDAIEAWGPYVDRFRLLDLYDRVMIGDVTADKWEVAFHGQGDGPGWPKVDATTELAVYDLVLMGDVIEHIPMTDAMNLLRRVPGRVVICTPVDFFDNDPDHQHPPTEEHVSHWTDDAWDLVAGFRTVEVRYQSMGGWLVRLGPLDGS